MMSPSKKMMAHQRGRECGLGHIQHIHSLGLVFYSKVLNGNCLRPPFCIKSPLTHTQRDYHKTRFQNVFLLSRFCTEGWVSSMRVVPTWQVWEGRRDSRCRNWIKEVSALNRLKHPGWRKERNQGLWVQGHGHKVSANHKASGKGKGQKWRSELQDQKSGE